MKVYNFKVGEKDTKRRLDKFILSRLKRGFSRTFIQDLINKGMVRVDGEKVKSHYKIKYNQNIEVNLSKEEKSSLKPISYDLDIIYEDEYIIVVNKPSGLMVHPAERYIKKDKNIPTLVNALLYHCKNLSHIAGTLKPGIVHRLDKETSGLIIAAKNDFAHKNLAEQFKKRKIKKIYIAIVTGRMELEKGIVDLPIGRSISRKTNMGVSYIKGKQAVTEYEVVKYFKDYTLVKVMPETGRTHQIRVHLAYIGHSILGDKRYGFKKYIERQALHAYKITIRHPKTDKYMVFTCPLPEDIKGLIDGEGIILDENL